MSSSFIDFRSDTVTKPTQKMRDAMCNAVVGDDVYHEDPTVARLEETMATYFGKQSALFFPTGTMSNLCALLTWCSVRGSEIIVGDKSHIFLYEQAGACQFGGISMRTVPNLPDGTLSLKQVQEAIREEDIHEPITRLICIENTHNACGGKILPLSFLQELRSKTMSIPIHMDGARIWNAMEAMDYEQQENADEENKKSKQKNHMKMEKAVSIAKHVDSMTVCLSKGLGAPAGSVLIGSTEFIEKARRIRKALGGGMRQVGILAAAGMEAICDFENGILEEDHKKAKTLVQALKCLLAFRIDPNSVETNILFLEIVSFDTSWEKKDVGSNIARMLKEKGIRVSVWSPDLLRLVVHRDISDEEIEKTIYAFYEISEYLLERNE